MSLHSLLALLRKAQNKKIHNYEKSFYFIFFKCFFLPLVQPLWWLQCNNTHKVVCVNGVNSKPSVFQCKPSTYDALNESLGKTSPFIREKWELCFIKYAEMMFQKFMIFLGNMRMVMCEEFLVTRTVALRIGSWVYSSFHFTSLLGGGAYTFL